MKLTQKEFFEKVAQTKNLPEELVTYAAEQVKKLEARRVAANARRSKKRQEEIAPQLEELRGILTTEPQIADTIAAQMKTELTIHKVIALLNELHNQGEVEKGYLTVDKNAKRSYKLKEEE